MAALTSGENPFSDPRKGMEALGIGKNMVQSLAFWIQATGVAQKSDTSGFVITDFGKQVFDADNGKEPWALAVFCGRVSEESEEAATFLRVHRGEAEPSTEIEKLWMEYWDGNPPQVSALKDVYLKRAATSQRSGTAYEGIVHAYKLAALCGSDPALRWLREQ